MIKNLDEQEASLALLSKQAKLLVDTLSPEKAQQCQKDVAELERQRADCKKITEARLERVNEAILQTEELETALKESIHWMDDVDRFLQEITGTIAEGDAETIESQVQEVEVKRKCIQFNGSSAEWLRRRAWDRKVPSSIPHETFSCKNH